MNKRSNPAFSGFIKRAPCPTNEKTDESGN
jgi:hypothetical protein